MYERMQTHGVHNTSKPTLRSEDWQFQRLSYQVSQKSANWFNSLETHSHSHTHTQSLSHTLSLTHTITLSHTLTHAYTHTHIHTHSHTLSLTHTHTLSNTHTLTHTLTHSLSHTLLLTLTHSHTHTLTHTHTHTYRIVTLLLWGKKVGSVKHVNERNKKHKVEWQNSMQRESER